MFDWIENVKIQIGPIARWLHWIREDDWAYYEMVLMTSCEDIDLLRDPGPVWEPEFPPIGSCGETRLKDRF
jgi:hypothetical protein